MSTQTMIDTDELFIGGESVRPQGTDRIAVIAASTEERVGSVPEGTNADIDAAVSAARAAFDDPSGWSSWSAEDRAEALERPASALESRRGDRTARLAAERHADLLCADQGPTMGVWSSGDPALSEGQMTRSAGNVAGPWRYERLEDVGHWMQLEASDEVNALLLDFLGGES